MASNEGLHQYFYAPSTGSGSSRASASRDDNTYQFIDVTYPDSRTAHYEYDVMGNRVYVDDRSESLDYALNEKMIDFLKDESILIPATK